MLKALLSRYGRFWQQIWSNKIIFNNLAETWRNILLNPEWSSQIHEILMGNVSIQKSNAKELSKERKFIETICNDKGVLKYIAENRTHAWVRSTYRGYYAFWESRYPGYMVPYIPCLIELRSNNIISYRDYCSIPNSVFATCNRESDSGIDFIYKKNYFRYYMYPSSTAADVYLMKSNWQDYEYTGVESKDDHKRFYCFDASYGLRAEELRMQLDYLIQKRNKS